MFVENESAESHVALRFSVQFNRMSCHAILTRHPCGGVASSLQTFGVIRGESQKVVIGEFATGRQSCGLRSGSQFKIGGIEPEPIQDKSHAAHHDNHRHSDHRCGQAASAMRSKWEVMNSQHGTRSSEEGFRRPRASVMDGARNHTESRHCEPAGQGERVPCRASELQFNWAVATEVRPWGLALVAGRRWAALVVRVD